ncbi:MAG: hypothetical protein JWM28_1640 [Chitinophagaceae bacterium]|nr:hypothetical protein [Chitinophagaceae bacterium]
MKTLSTVFVVLFAVCITACDKPAAPKSFCSDPCLKDTLKFTGAHPGKPYVYISAKSCTPDTILWSHADLVSNRKMGLSGLLGQPVSINKQFVRCDFYDTSYAWVQLNDCSTFRGYLLKLPFNKKNSISKYSSALTNFDPKYKVEEGLICYADYTFIYVEDKATGKIEKTLLADKQLDIDYNNVHATFDSVNVTRNRIFVNLLQGKEIKTIEKQIKL